MLINPHPFCFRISLRCCKTSQVHGLRHHHGWPLLDKPQTLLNAAIILRVVLSHVGERIILLCRDIDEILRRYQHSNATTSIVQDDGAPHSWGRMHCSIFNTCSEHRHIIYRNNRQNDSYLFNRFPIITMLYSSYRLYEANSDCDKLGFFLHYFLAETNFREKTRIIYGNDRLILSYLTM